MKLTLLVALLLPTLLFGQKITGKATDATNQPIPGVTVAVVKSNIGTMTNENGFYELGELTAGTYKVAFSAIGYERQEETVIISQQPVILNIKLMESAEQLQTIEVVGRKETDYKNSASFIGTKSATLLKDVPQSISYVTKELMLDQAAFRVNDIVKNMSGVNQYSFYNDITIRGHRVKGQGNSSMLINGQRAFTSFWKQQLIPHIERVEVIKGPASAMFGNASAGGTINRVTKKPLDEQYQSISTTFGSFETFRTVADFTGPLNGDKTVLYRLNVGYENSGSFRDLQFDKNIIVAPSISFIPNEKTRINADLVIQKSDTRLDRGQSVLGDGDLFSTPISTSLNSVNDFLKEDTYNFTLNFAQKLAPNLTFNTSYMRSNYGEDLLEHRSANTYAKDGMGEIIPSEVEMQVFIRKRNWNADNVSTYLNYDVSTGKIKHKFLLGYDYAQQEQLPGGSQLRARGYRNAENDGAVNSYNPAKSANYLLDAKGNPVPNVPHFGLGAANSYVLRDMSKYFYSVNDYDPSFLRTQGFYLQDQIQIEKFQVLIGLRQDYFTDLESYNTESEMEVTQNAFLPRLGLVYSATKNINAYATYVTGYQPQSASAINNPLAGGPFNPLESELLEAGVKTEWLDQRLTISAAVYNLTVNGQLYNAGEAGNPEKLIQIGEEVAKGFEFDVIGQLATNWSFIANYAFNDAKITVSDDESEANRQKPNAPKHQGNFWTKYTVNKGNLSGLGLALGSNFVSERLGSIVPTGQNPKVFPSYQLWNAGIYYTVKKVRLQLNINNLTNKTHWVGGYDYLRAFPGAPRSWLGTISYTL
jgi:iron complex outermembrane receptor protein